MASAAKGARYQFGLRDLMLATALVSIYAAALIVPLRGVPVEAIELRFLVGPSLQLAAMVVFLTLVRWRRVRMVQPTGLVLIADVPWRRILVIATLALVLSLAARLMSPTWRLAAPSAMFPFAAASVMFILQRDVNVGRHGLIYLWFFLPWTSITMQREQEDDRTASRLKGPKRNALSCFVSPELRERIEALHAEALKSQQPESTWPMD